MRIILSQFKPLCISELLLAFFWFVLQLSPCSLCVALPPLLTASSFVHARCVHNRRIRVASCARDICDRNTYAHTLSDEHKLQCKWLLLRFDSTSLSQCDYMSIVHVPVVYIVWFCSPQNTSFSLNKRRSRKHIYVVISISESISFLC